MWEGVRQKRGIKEEQTIGGDCGVGGMGREREEGKRERGEDGRPWKTMISGNDAVKVGQLGLRGKGGR